MKSRGRFTGERKDDRCYIAIVGSRRISDFDYVERKFLEVLDDVDLVISDVILVSGGARGVDTIAREITKKYGLEIIEILPEWNKYGKAAGPMRNTRIVELSDIIIAIPDSKSRGTWDTIRKAKARGKILYVFRYES